MMAMQDEITAGEGFATVLFALCFVAGLLIFAGLILLGIGFLASPSWGDGHTDAGRVLRFLDESIKPLLAGSALLLGGLLLANIALIHKINHPT